MWYTPRGYFCMPFWGIYFPFSPSLSPAGERRDVCRAGQSRRCQSATHNVSLHHSEKETSVSSCSVSWEVVIFWMFCFPHVVLAKNQKTGYSHVQFVDILCCKITRRGKDLWKLSGPTPWSKQTAENTLSFTL